MTAPSTAGPAGPAGQRPGAWAGVGDVRPAVRRVVWPLLATALVAVLLVGVFPIRTYLAQRADLARADAQLEVLRDQNAALDRRAGLLQSDAEIERLARERYNLVRPGEEAYAMLPPPGAPTTTTTAPARPAEREARRNVVQRAWDAVTGLF